MMLSIFFFLFRCLHYRDWLAGQWIPDQIQQSVARSKRTLIILSDHFLESLWGQLEFRTAYQQVMQDRKMRLIIIVIGDLPSKDKMDHDLSSYLSLNTFLKWGDPWFWDRLRYALPHKKCLDGGRNMRIANAIIQHGDTVISKRETSNVKLELPPLPLPATPVDQSQIIFPQTPTSSASSTAPLFPSVPA
jgi:protein toll